jgi:hypothetical protein
LTRHAAPGSLARMNETATNGAAGPTPARRRRIDTQAPKAQEPEPQAATPAQERAPTPAQDITQQPAPVPVRAVSVVRVKGTPGRIIIPTQKQVARITGRA